MVLLLVVADRATEWRRLKALVLDSVSSPITRRVYNLGLDEFIAWYTEAPRPAGFTKATVTAWRSKPADSGLSLLMSGSRRSGNWQWRRQNPDPWHRRHRRSLR